MTPVLMACLLSAGAADLTAPNRDATRVDASRRTLFGLRWWRPIVRTGMDRTVVDSTGQPGIAQRAQVIIVGTGEGDVIALRKKTGDELWRYRHGQPFEAAVTIITREDDAGRKREVALLSSRDGAMLALGARRGNLIWKADLGVESRAPVVVAGDKWIVTTIDNNVRALNPETGEEIWSGGRPAPSGLTVRGHSKPWLEGDILYATFSDGYVEAISVKDGGKEWSRPLSLRGGEFVDADADPIIVDGVLFVASYSDGLYALEPKDGKTLWSQEAPALTSIGTYENMVVAASADGYVWGLSRDDGEMVYRTRIPAGPVSRLTVRHNLAVMTNGEVGLLVLDAASGRPLQASPVSGRLAGDPGWSGKDLAAISSAGQLYVYRLGAPGPVN